MTPLLHLNLLPNGLFALAKDERVSLGQREWIDLKAGATSNFASIPWYGRWIISPIDPEIQMGAFVHDQLVGESDKRTPIWDESGSHFASWREAAYWLRRIMEEHKAPLWKRQIVYGAVRLHGWLAGKK